MLPFPAGVRQRGEVKIVPAFGLVLMPREVIPRDLSLWKCIVSFQASSDRPGNCPGCRCGQTWVTVAAVGRMIWKIRATISREPTDA